MSERSSIVINKSHSNRTQIELKISRCLQVHIKSFCNTYKKLESKIQQYQYISN